MAHSVDKQGERNEECIKWCWLFQNGAVEEEYVH